MAEWLKAADCKSAHVCVRWFESSSAHHLRGLCESASPLLLESFLENYKNLSTIRTVARAVEWARLESECACKRTEGSNPSLSAIFANP